MGAHDLQAVIAPTCPIVSLWQILHSVTVPVSEFHRSHHCQTLSRGSLKHHNMILSTKIGRGTAR